MAGPWEKYSTQSSSEDSGSGPWANYQTPKSSMSAGQAAIEGFGQFATAGYLPQLQALAGGLIPDSNAQLDKDLQAQGFKISQPEDTYLSRRDENIGRQEKLAQEQPVSYYGGGVAGLLTSAPAIGGAISKLPLLGAKSTGLLAKTAQAAGGGAVMGALQNPGDEQGKIDPIQAEQRMEGAKTGAKMGAFTQLGATAAQGVAGAIKAVPKKLQDYAAMKAFKSSGAMLKDIRKADARGRTLEIGKEMIDSGLIKPGSTFEDIALKSGQIKQKTGKSIGDIYQTVGESALPKVDADSTAMKLIDAVSDPSVRPKLNTDTYDNAMDKMIQSITHDKAKLSDVRYLNDLIGELDDLINYSKRNGELPSLQKGYLKLRQTLRGIINQSVEATGVSLGKPELKQALLDANKRYGIMAEVSSIARDRVARENVNRFMSLTDTLVGTGGAAGGAVMGSLLSGNVEGGLKGAALGAGAGLLNKGARLYGNPILTQAASKTGGLLSKVPSPVTSGIQQGAGYLVENPAVSGVIGSGLLSGPGTGKKKP